MTTQPFLAISNIQKSHDGEETLKGIDLQIEQGEILCLLGPSGCGKTTLLRIIAGLEKPDKGTVLKNGKSLEKVPPHQRNFSMMFQEFALFPHKNVLENISFGLEMKGLNKNAILEKSKEMMKLVGLSGLEKRDVLELSGGELQRVALARSLAPSPDLLMLDEPMGSLDRALRERLVADLRSILKKVKATVIFVTHDQNEAFVLADRVAVFNTGYIEQVSTPELLYKKPANEFVARFLGFQNLLPVEISSKGEITSAIGRFSLEGNDLLQDDHGFLLIRPEAASWISDNKSEKNDELRLEGVVNDSKFQGSVFQVTIEVEEKVNLVFNFPSDSTAPGLNETVQFQLKKSALSLIKDS